MNMRTLLGSLAVLLSTACVPGIGPSRTDDPDNPPDSAIDGEVTVVDADTTRVGARYYTNDSTLHLRIVFGGAAAKASVSVNGIEASSFSTATEHDVSLDLSDQFHTVAVTFRDSADHQGATVRLDVELDTEAPVISSDSYIVTDHRPDRGTDGQCTTKTSNEPVVDFVVGAEDSSSTFLRLFVADVFDTDSDGTVNCDGVSFDSTESGALFLGAERTVLSADAGLHAICVQLADAAGNRTQVEKVGEILLDAEAPTSPRIRTAGAIVDAAAYPIELTQSSDTGSGLAGYMVTGGCGEKGGSELGTGGFGCDLFTNGAFEFSFCETCTEPASASDTIEVSFVLRQSFSTQDPAQVENILRVRAIDCAGNTSDDDFRFIVEDSRTPRAPQDARAIEEDGAVMLRWDPPSDLDRDVSGYRIYYGTVSQDFAGTFATGGPSPIDVGNVHSYRLTGLPNGTAVYVSVTALDDTAWVEPSSSAPPCSTAMCDGLTPVKHAGACLCPTAHESTFSEEIAVLANPVTPEPLPTDTLSSGWVRLSVPPDQTRLFVSAGSALYPFHTDFVTNGDGTLALQSNVDKAFWDQLTPEEQASSQLQHYNYVISQDVLAPYDHFCANGSAADCSPYLDLDCNPDQDPSCDPRVNDNCLARCKPGLPVISEGYAGGVAFSSEKDLAYVANGSAGVLIVSNPTDGYARLRGTLGNPANFSRHVAVFPNTEDEKEVLAVGGERGLQLYALSSQNPQSTASHTSPSFVRTVLTHRSVRGMVWDPKYEVLFVSVYPDGIAVLDANLEFVDLDGANPFCPAAFTRAGEPHCDIVDLERLAFPPAANDSEASERDMLILADSFFGVAFLDVTDLVSAATGQLGFCPTDFCMTQIRPGTLRAIEVYPPYLLALGSNRPSFARTGEPAGQDQQDRYWAEGAVVEVVEAQNRSRPAETVGTLFAPESKADPATPGTGWQLMAAGADMRVLRVPGGEATAVIAQRNLGLRAYSLAGLPDLSAAVDLTPAAPGDCVRPAKVMGDARSLAVTGSRLLVGDGEAGLQVLSLKDPTRPRHELEQELGPTCTLTAPTQRARALDVAVTGPFAFVATSGAGVRLLDLRPIVATPTQILTPADAARVSDFSVQIGLGARDLDGQITDQDLPSSATVDPYPSASVVRVAARRDRLWFVGFDSGTVESSVGPGQLNRLRLKLFAWDTSPLYDRTLPLAGSYDVEPTAWDRTAFEEHRVDFEHLVAFPLDASTSDFTNVDDLLTNLEVNGDFLYLGIGYQEECPRTQGCGDTAFGGIIRVRADPEAWIGGAAGADELDPFSSELGFFTYPSALPRQIQVRGQFIFVADDYRGLVLLREADGELVATLEPSGQARSLAVEGNLVYLGTTEGLQIVAVDSQDETATLSTVGFVKSPAPVLDVLVQGGLAYLAAGEAGVRVVELADVSKPAPFPVAPFTDDDGSPAGEFSVSGTVAFLVSEGLDFFQRFDNKLRILDLDSPEEPLQAASTRIAAVGATHVHVDGGSVYVSLLRPIASGAIDPYEQLRPSVSNNNTWQQATPISAGYYAGAIAAGDPDWYLIRPDGIGSEDSFAIEVLVPDGIGDLEWTAMIEADCTVDPTDPEPDRIFSANDGPQPFFINNNAGGTDVCVYLKVQSFADHPLEYAVRVQWETLETCSSLTGDTLDTLPDECDSSGDVLPGIAGAPEATYHLCGPDAGTSEFYAISVPAENEAFVSVRHDSGVQDLDLYASSLGGTCPVSGGPSDIGTNDVHAVVLGNPNATPATFLIEVRHVSGTSDSPYVLQIHIGGEVEQDAFGNEDGISRAVVAGRYHDLLLPGSGVDRFHIQADAADDGEGLCFSVQEAVEGPVTGFLDNGDLVVRDGSGKIVTSEVAPKLVPAVGKRCLETPREEYAEVTAPCDASSFCQGRIELTVANPNPFPVSYILDVGYREETGGLTDSAEPNDTIAAADGSVPFVEHARLVQGPAFVSPLFIAAGEKDYYPIAIEAGTWLSVQAERDANSPNQMTVELVDSEDRLVAAPLYRSAHATALGYVARTSGTFYLRVRSDGPETGFGDYYFLEIDISDGDAVNAEVGSFNLTPIGLTSVAHSDMRPALSDAMAAWGPYAYHLTFNGTSRLTVTRFSETNVGIGGLIMPLREDLLFSEPVPTPPFTMVAEGPRVFVAEIETSLLWYVDVSPVLAGAAGAAVIRGPWRLFPEEAAGISGILLYGPTLFVSNAARGLIVALDTSELVTQASGASSTPGAWADLELGSGEPWSTLQPMIDSTLGEPVVGVSASTNVAGALALSGTSLVSGLVGVSQDGPRGVGTAIFDVSGVLALAPDPFPMTEPQVFSPVGAATVGAIHVAVAGPYLYVSNENGFQVLDLR
jgi:hypothetical protein